MPITASLKQFLRDTIPDWDHNGMPLNVRENFWKIVKCGTPALGAEVFASTTSQKIVYHTCKSRFCPSCGIRDAGIWQAKLEVAIPDIPYREINFTMPQVFWSLFQQNRGHVVCRYPIPRLIGHGCGSSKNINSAPTSAIFFVKLIMSICFICASSTFQ